MSRFGILLLTTIAAVGVAALLVLVQYKADLDTRRGATARCSRIAQLDKGIVEYAERGAGVPLLSIHGAGGGFDQGLANAAELVGGGFRIIAPSRFGYLGTPVPADASVAAQGEAHAALLSKLGIARAVVVGVSAGARSAVELALSHPDQVAGLILIVPALDAPGNPVAIEQSRGSSFVFWIVNLGGDFLWWIAEKTTPSMLIRFLGVPPELLASQPPAERERIMTIVRSVEPLSLRFRGIDLDSIPRPGDALNAIAIPTLIITARDDLFNTRPGAEHAAGEIPNARLVIYDTGGHLLVGRTAETRAEVRRFLSDLPPLPASGGSRAPECE